MPRVKNTSTLIPAEPCFDPPSHPGYPLSHFGLGDAVWVHAMGTWYPGVISDIGTKAVEAAYTSGAGVTRRKRVNPEVVWAGNRQPGQPRGGAKLVGSPLVLDPKDYRAFLHGRPLRFEETWPTCECGARRDPHTGRLACAR